MNIQEEVQGIEDELIGFRQALHQCPEIAFHEHMTNQYIRDHLASWGIDFTQLDPTGIIGVVGQGEETIALRGDMDGLEVEEETKLTFSSQNPGYMHACGHDGHLAILLATAKILKNHETELKHKILLIFQPAEETAQGAKLVLKEPIMKEVQRIYGLHIFNQIEAGKISLEAGPRMASTYWFSIRIHGRAGHAGKPQDCVDTAVVASSLVMNLQTIMSRSVDPLASGVITVGKIDVGIARNITPGEGVLEGTFRAFSTEVAKDIKERMQAICQGAQEMYGARVVLEIQESVHPALINDEEVARQGKEEAMKVIVPEDFIDLPPMMLGEDFANYLSQIKGCFAFVGGGGEYPNHNSQFDFSVKALTQGVKLMLAFANV